MPDVLLVQPPMSFTNPMANSGSDVYHVGLSYLSAALKNRGISYLTLNDSNASYSIEDILDLCQSQKVKILGISAVTPTIRTAVKLAKRIKEVLDDQIHILLGNAHVSVDPYIMIRYPYFDSAIDGEADISIVEHVVRILQGEKIRGILKADYPKQLDSLPFPDFSSEVNTFFRKGSAISIVGTRGCPYQCGYCCRPALSKIVRVRSAQNIVAEIKTRLNLTRQFFFNDDAATIRRDNIISLCDLILRSGIKINFQMITRIDMLDLELLCLMKKAGCTSLLVGIESGNERIRNRIIQKNLSDEKIYSGMSATKKADLPVQLFFMIGHPEETIAEITDSINMPIKLEKMGFNNIEIVGYHLTLPLPGTRYFQWCLEKGKVQPTIIDDYINDKLGDGFYGHWPYLVPEGLTLLDLQKYKEAAAKKFYLRPEYFFRRFLQDIFKPSQIFMDVKNAFFVIKQGSSADRSKVDS